MTRPIAPRSGAGVGVGMLRGAGDSFTWKEKRRFKVYWFLGFWFIAFGLCFVFYGFIILWFCDFMVAWFMILHLIVLWFYVLCFYGFMVVWLYGFMVLQCYGLWIYGAVFYGFLALTKKHLSISCFQEDIDTISKFFKILLDGSSSLFGARLFRNRQKLEFPRLQDL